MNLKTFLKNELIGWGKYERIIFPAILGFIILISFYLGDSKVALMSAICGIGYTILAGKGKISCYIIGLCGTFCYSYISYKNAFWGNLALYMFYCMPMQIIGILSWKNHLKKDTKVIYKKTLTLKENITYWLLSLLLIIILYIILLKLNDSNPIIDAITSILSILGLLLTVKRCIEQWYAWMIVNFLSAIMWIVAYINGSNCFATVLMWITYFFVGIYFLTQWKKELSSGKT